MKEEELGALPCEKVRSRLGGAVPCTLGGPGPARSPVAVSPVHVQSLPVMSAALF